MSVFDGYIQIEGSRIDKGKVLLILNAGSALDAQVVDYYQSARGLTDHRLSFSSALLASTDLAVVLAQVLTPIADYIKLHDIDCVIAAPSIPLHPNLSFPMGVANFDALFGAAVGGTVYSYPYQLSNYPSYQPLVNYDVTLAGGDSYPVFEPHQNVGNGWGYAAGDIQTPDDYRANVDYFKPWIIKNLHKTPSAYAANPKYFIPWGRLGYPFSYGQQQTFGTGLFHDVKRMIDDCIFAEQQPLDSKKITLGFGDYGTWPGSHPWQWAAWKFAEAKGLQLSYYTNDAAGTGARGLPAAVRNNLPLWLGKQPDYDSATVINGSGAVAADYYFGSAIINDGVMSSVSPGTYWTSLAPKRGAWAFNWCSSGNQFVENLIRRGGAAGLGPSREPYVKGLPDDASLMAVALRGYSLAEMLYYTSPPGWAMTAFGDPLYQPFRGMALPDGQLLSVTDVSQSRGVTVLTPEHAASLSAIDRAITNATPARTAAWQS